MSSYIKKFNPYDLPEATLKAIATGRERVLEEILAIIASNAEGGRVQHLQVVAPRGYGKSFLMRMVQSTLSARVAEGLPAVLALLPEEQHNVDAPHRLLNEIQRILEGRPAGSLLGGAFEESDGAWEEAVDASDKAIAAKLPEGRGIAVAIVENFDQLIEDIFRKPRDQSRLRALLDRPGGRLMLLATATRRADATYEQRLFHATRLIELEPWREEACIGFFEKLRAHRRAGPMSPQLQAKAKALAQFIGGSPRMATVLAEVLENNDSLRVAQMLDALVDELTPYYKHQIESLSRRARTLLDALLRMGEPRTQSEIAARLGVVQSRIAEPFNELRAGGEVVGVKAQHSAEMLYRVSDRLMAHYYRKRHLGVGEGTSLLEGIVEFLESFYTPEEKRSEAERLRTLGHVADAAVFDRLVINAPGESGWSGSEQTKDWLNELRERVWELARSGQTEEAVVLCKEAVKRAEASDNRLDQVRSLQFLGFALGQEKLYREAEVTLRRSLTLAEQVGDRDEQGRAAYLLSLTLGQVHRYAEAEQEARRAIALLEQSGDRSQLAHASSLLGLTFLRMDRHAEAVEELRRAVTLSEQADDPEAQTRSLRILGWALCAVGRYPEAALEMNRAMALAEELGNAFGFAWAAVGRLALAVASGTDEEVLAEWQRVRVALASASAGEGLPSLQLWAEIVAVPALRVGQFHTFWSTGAALLPGLETSSLPRDLADAVWKASRDQGRAAAYALAMHGIEVLVQAAAVRATRSDVAGPDPSAFLRSFLSALAQRLTEPGLLRDIVALLEQRLPGETAAERALIDAAAQRLEAPDDAAAVERVDPDVARALELTRGSASTPARKPKPAPSKRSSKPRRKK